MVAHHIVPVVAAVAAEVALGMLWYSDYMFGPMFKKAGGKSVGKDLYEKIGMHAVASLITASALMIAISVFQKANADIYTKEGLGRLFAMFFHDNAPAPKTLMASMKTAGFLWAGFLAPAKAVCAVWSSENMTKFAIEALSQLAGVLVMAAVITHFSM